MLLLPGFSVGVITGVVAKENGAFALIRDTQLALDDVLRDYSLANRSTNFHLRFVLLKLATAHDQVSTHSLNRMPTFLVAIPLDERAIAETNRSRTLNLGDLIARPPE